MNNVIELNSKSFDTENFNSNPIKDFLHDVRSPLQALQALTTNHGLDKTQENELFEKCMKRIKSLTETQSTNIEENEICIANILSDIKREKMIERGIETKISIKTRTVWFKTLIKSETLANILSNLINNSVNAGEKQEVRIDVSCLRNKLLISLTDNGAGIDSKTISEIGGYGKSFTAGGSGIALANTVKELNKIGATLSCRSIPSIITKFTISIPLL